MYREIIKTQSRDYLLHIPDEYLGINIEIVILPLNSGQSNQQSKLTENIFQKTAGILKHKKIDPLEWQRNIRNEWERE